MFGALGRWMKSVWYYMTGRIDDSRRDLDMNHHVVRARFDAIIREKTNQIQQYKRAVAGLIAQQEGKMGKVKVLTEEVTKLERLKAGALAKAKQAVENAKKAGKTQEQIRDDEDYRKCLSAYNDFSSTLAEKQERIEELEGDIGGYTKRIADHKVQLESLVRDIDKLKSEAADAVADMITGKQEKEIADALSGIGTDGTAKELQDLRNLRQEVKAEARVSKELAGTDSRAQEAEFLEYARSHENSDEFDNLIGLAESKDTSVGEADAAESAESEDASVLPE